MRVMLSLLERELRLAMRQGGAIGMAVSFFLVAVSLFPFSIGADLPLLTRIGPGIIWVAALLASLLSLDRLFQADFEDGALDQLMISPLMPELTVLIKCLAHWLTTAVPLILVTPLVAVEMNLSGSAAMAAMLALLFGTPALSLAGAIGAALAAGIRRGGVLVPLLVLPLCIPVLIFGAAASGTGPEAGTASLILIAISLFMLALGPIAAAAALKLALE